jgi:hypothetical protein
MIDENEFISFSLFVSQAVPFRPFLDGANPDLIYLMDLNVANVIIVKVFSLL